MRSELLKMQARYAGIPAIKPEELFAPSWRATPPPAILQSPARLKRESLPSAISLSLKRPRCQEKLLVEHARKRRREQCQPAARQHGIRNLMIGHKRSFQEEQASQLADREQQFERWHHEQAGVDCKAKPS